jgi:hypothetical protein
MANLPAKNCMSSNFTSQQIQFIIESWPGSGMTQAEYARSNNIPIHTLRYWLYKRRKSSVDGSAFIELKNVFKGSHHILLRYPNGVELQLPAGTTLQMLKTLISI